MEQRSGRGGAHRHQGQLSLFDDPSAEVASDDRNPVETDRPVANAMPRVQKVVRKVAIPETVEPDSAPSFAERLGARLSNPVRSLVFTRNRTRIVSARPSKTGDGLDIRIHRCFDAADDSVVAAVADFLEARSEAAKKRGLAIIREHFREHGQEDTRLPKNLRAQGDHYDLRVLRDRVNRDYFSGRLSVEITWSQGAKVSKGRTGKKHSRRKSSFSIRLGSYDERLKLVRIHPVLDRRDVPEYVIESIVYHEMLHAVVPPRRGAGRRSVHPPEFRRMEKLYAYFEEAEAWLSANIERLARLR